MGSNFNFSNVQTGCTAELVPSPHPHHLVFTRVGRCPSRLGLLYPCPFLLRAVMRRRMAEALSWPVFVWTATKPASLPADCCMQHQLRVYPTAEEQRRLRGVIRCSYEAGAISTANYRKQHAYFYTRLASRRIPHHLGYHNKLLLAKWRFRERPTSHGSLGGGTAPPHTRSHELSLVRTQSRTALTLHHCRVPKSAHILRSTT